MSAGDRGGARRQPHPSIGAVTTAAERLTGSPMTAEQRTDENQVDC